MLGCSSGTVVTHLLTEEQKTPPRFGVTSILLFLSARGISSKSMGTGKVGSCSGVAIACLEVHGG